MQPGSMSSGRRGKQSVIAHGTGRVDIAESSERLGRMTFLWPDKKGLPSGFPAGS